MIYFVRSADIKHGKHAEAFEWGVRAAAYMRQNLGTDHQVIRNIGGAGYQIHWVVTYDSLAAYEEVAAKILADEGYQALAAEVVTKDLLGDINDSLFATVP